MEKIQRNLEYYRRLPYTLHIEPITDSDGSTYWIAEFVELRGCKTDGQTEIDAVANLQQLFDEYILALIGEKVYIPEPAPPAALTIEPIWIIIENQVEVTQKTGVDIKAEFSTPINELAAA